MNDKKNHVLHIRFSQNELLKIARALEKYNQSVSFGELSVADLVRRGSSDLANRILMAKEIKMEFRK